jgi:hypothetical protein
MAEQLVRIRVMGPLAAVAIATDRVRLVLTVAEESDDYTNRRGAGVRRYLAALVPVDDVHDQEMDRGC